MTKPHNYNNLLLPQQRSRIMYIDMNSFFASCEQQLREELRGRPIGVCPYEGPNAVVIAASKEAKKFGIKTGMLFKECKLLCPGFIMVATRPVEYRRVHVKLMNILRRYVHHQDIIPKSIDEAVVNLAPYTNVYADVFQLAQQIKKDIASEIGSYITCSIGISGNVFLAKLATEIQKPDGLIHITPENIDAYLEKMKLTDLPGIAKANEKRLMSAGIYSPFEMRSASEALLRKIFGGVVGNYWYYRLHFKEVDFYTSDYKRMSAMRSLSSKTRSSYHTILSMLISLCTRLEQRMVKQNVFCRYLCFYASYYDAGQWKAGIKLNQPLQDAMDMLHYIEMRIKEHEQISKGKKIIRQEMSAMGVLVGDFIDGKYLQYSLFDNRMQKDKLRKIMYNIKDQYGKNILRKASETILTGQMKDAIGFGSVKDMYQDAMDVKFNKYLLEEDAEMA